MTQSKETDELTTPHGTWGNRRTIDVSNRFSLNHSLIRPSLAHGLLLVVAALLGVRAGKRWLEAMKSEWIHNLVMAGIVGSGAFYIYESMA